MNMNMNCMNMAGGAMMPMQSMQPMVPMQPMPSMQPMAAMQPMQMMGAQVAMAPADVQKMQMQQAAMMQAQMANMMMASMCMPMMYVPTSQGGAMATSAGVPGANAAVASLGCTAPKSEKMEKYQKLVKRKQKDNANVVFVGGLRKTTEEDRVCSHFAKFGQVDQVDIKRLPDGTSRGFAFVKFEDCEAVDKVIDAHAKHMIDNKWVEVKRHDGMAACAGMTATLAKKVEDEDKDEVEEDEKEDEPAPNSKEWEEQWSTKYLQMAQQLGSEQQMKQQQDAQAAAMKQQMEAAQVGGMGGHPMMGMQAMGSMGGMQMAMVPGIGPMMMMAPGMMQGMQGMPGMQALGRRPTGALEPGVPGHSGSQSRSSSSSSSSSRSSGSASPPPPPPPEGPTDASAPSQAVAPAPPGAPSAGSASFSGTLSSMLKGPAAEPEAAANSENDSSRVAARAAAAAFAVTANQFFAQNRDAARDAAAVKAVRASQRQGADERAPHQRTDGKQQMKLWVPEAGMREPAPEAPRRTGRPEPAPAARKALSPRPRSSSSGSRKKKRSGSPAKKRGGFDSHPPPPPPPTTQAPPSRPALPPGVTEAVPGGVQNWAGHVQVNRFGIPEATREALAAAVMRAQQVEAQGLDSIRRTGQIPRGPPDLPTGTEVIEQKCVAYLIGRGGQALAAINAAAGVSIQIDQSTKTFGWSMANLYGTEEGAVKAKMILRQKISEYRPLRG